MNFLETPLPASYLKEMVLKSEVKQEGHFIFANGNHGLAKLEMDNLWNHPNELDVILKHLALAKNLPKADVILGVPAGGQYLAEAIVQKYLTDIPFAKLERVPGGAKQDFRFCSDNDWEIALSARSPRIYEDVVTSLSSIAGVVKLLDPSCQNIHSLAIWRRGEVNKIYRRGIMDHYLIEEILQDFTPDQCPQCVTE